MKLVRRGVVRLVGLGAITVCTLAYIYFYTSNGTTSHLNKDRSDDLGDTRWTVAEDGSSNRHRSRFGVLQNCQALTASKTDVDTVEQFSKFDFQFWMKAKEFWDANFEKRYLRRRTKWKKLPLKVILMPHSHNDPGWLKTFEDYYFHQTSKILQNMIERMNVHTNMTFIWTEIAYLSMWYDRAHPSQRQQLKNLINSGRVEIPTGGWVMTDEANVHLYSMVDQLIEGHQWLDMAMGIHPVSGWSVDPFGHGSTLPYLLKESGISGTVFQRIHYAWKQWLAEQQYGDFLWRQTWDASGEMDLLTHNLPYDIYSIKHSCGPNAQICLNYDFRKVPGEYTEYSIKAVPIEDHNVKAKSEVLLEQYGRTGSLYPHNVVLVPLGDDFRYDHATEWDQQYTSYQKMIDWINSNPQYNANLQWGTLKDYFKEVNNRMKEFPTLKGDFFVYSDIFSEGRPAYWSGYFTTRPYWKVLARQLEGSLRNSEILFTWALFSAAQHGKLRIFQILEKNFEKLVRARRHLALFQHHDAITGTSKAAVMHDYAMKLFDGIHSSVAVAGHAAQSILTSPNLSPNDQSLHLDNLQSDIEQASYDRLPRKIPISLNKKMREIVLFNSLAHHRVEVVKILLTSADIKITNEVGQDISFQINPVWNNTGNGMAIMLNEFEVLFLADLSPLSLAKYTIMHSPNSNNKKAIIYSNYYALHASNNGHHFETKNILPGDIQLESDQLKLLFEGNTGLLRSVTNKITERVTQAAVNFASYPSAQFKSGAYLFKPDPNARDPEENVLAGAKPKIFIHSGLLMSEITVIYGSVLMHTVKIFHVTDEPLASAISIENVVDFSTTYNSSETPGFSPHYRETELFMRIVSDIDNGINPLFYTDQNGFQMQRRSRVKQIGIQGNYYPITSAAYLEESERRMTLITDHAAGAASWEQGWLEVMLERRTFYDDARGMGEGVTDQKRTLTRYWLLIEEMEKTEETVSRLSLVAHYLVNALNYPPMLFTVENLSAKELSFSSNLLSKPLPCSLHLMNIRTLAEPTYPGLLPSKKALLIVHNQTPSCCAKSNVSKCGYNNSLLLDTDLTIQVTQVEEMDLTGGTSKKQIKSLSEAVVSPMRLKTLKLSFEPKHKTAS